jgi:hypothetical protein
MKRFLLFAFTLVGLLGWQPRAVAQPGCDPSNVAVAHYGDGALAGASGAPMVCSGTTGYGAAEPHIEVSPNGEVVAWPAGIAPGLGQLPNPVGGPQPSNLYTSTWAGVYSSDQGASWQLFEPDGKRFACCDQHLHIDRVTGRLYVSVIFGSDPTGTGPMLESQTTSSPGHPFTSWFPMTNQVGHVSENPRFATAPAPAGQPQPIAGERMAYWCANSSVSSTTRDCVRSFDGGATWEFASHLYGHPLAARHTECGTNTETAGYPQGGPDGSLWVQFTCGANTYLARSRDEGTTWPFEKKPDGITPLTIPPVSQLRVDTAGNLYAVSTSGSATNLRVSSDGGQTWRGPFNMTAPAARTGTIGQRAFSDGYRPGDFVASYFVARPGGGSDAYMTVTHNALDPNPLFYSARINPPYRAMMTAGHAGDDFLDAAIGPDGTPWAYYYSDCLRDRHGNFVDPWCAATGGQESVSGDSQSHATTISSLRFP